jgi:gp16 family phage-associated protein
MAKKAADVKAQLKAEGVTIADWAKARGFNVLTVYRVLAGKGKWTRGESHRIAVALGMKDMPRVRRFSPDIAA